MGPGAVLTVEGLVTATPTATGTGVYPLHMPFLLVPRGDSQVVAGPPSPYKVTNGVANANVQVRNKGIHDGTADVYTWGIYDKDHTKGIASIRAVGVQSQPADILGGDRQHGHAWSSRSTAGTSGPTPRPRSTTSPSTPTATAMPDYFVIGADLGYYTTGSFDGVEASFVYNVAAGAFEPDIFYADAPMNGSVIELPVLASDLGLTSAAPSFTYAITGEDLITGNVDAVATTATYNAFTPSTSNGQFATLARNASATLPLSVNVSLQKAAPALGWMVVSLDNPNGDDQAALIPVGKIPNH